MARWRRTRFGVAPGTLLVASLIALVAVVSGVTATVHDRGTLGAVAATTRPATAADLSGTTGCSYRTGARTAITADAVHRREMVIIGASYSHSLGATSPRAGYALQLAGRLRQHARVYAVPGSGFLNPGPRHQGTFGQRLAHVPDAPAPDLVLFQGGRDDLRYSATAERLAAERTLCAAHRHFAGARLALLGPVPGRLPVGHKLIEIDAALRAACHHDGALYIDALREKWMTPSRLERFSGPVPDHPNDAGYAYIAERTAQALAPLIAGTSGPS